MFTMHRNALDITNYRSGKLVALEPTNERKNRQVIWKCKCDCGNYCYIPATSIYSKLTQSCGKCNYEDLTIYKFTRLQPLYRVYEETDRRVLWRCKCDCGNECTVDSGSLKNGTIRSCGCLHKEAAAEHFKSHGLSNTRQYSIWQNMKSRCYNPNTPGYHRYGGRGIRICDEWLDPENGFINFYNWSVNNGYKDNLTIDRTNNDSDYTPENCRWITNQEQQYNKDTTLYYNGMSLSQYCIENGLNPKQIRKRKHYYKISLEEAIKYYEDLQKNNINN